MKIHGNARTCPRGRLLIVRRVEEQGWTLAETAIAAGVSVRTVSKWLRRYRLEAEQGGARLGRYFAAARKRRDGPLRLKDFHEPAPLFS